MGNIVTIDFHGSQLLGFEDQRGRFAAMKPIVEGIGIDWSSQHKRMQRDPILSEGMVMMTIPFARGGEQDAVCLPLDLMHGWLFRLDAARVKEEIRDRVLTFQRECFAVLARAFSGAEPDARRAGAPIVDMPTGESRKLVAEARVTFGVLPARELWFALGLPRTPSMYEQARQLELFRGEFARQSAGGRP